MRDGGGISEKENWMIVEGIGPTFTWVGLIVPLFLFVAVLTF